MPEPIKTSISYVDTSNEELPEPKSENDGLNITALSSPIKKTKRKKPARKDVFVKVIHKRATLHHIMPKGAFEKHKRGPNKGKMKSILTGKFMSGGLPRINMRGASQLEFSEFDKNMDAEIKQDSQNPAKKIVTKAIKKVKEVIDNKTETKEELARLDAVALEQKKLIAEQHVQDIEEQIKKSNSV